MINNDLKIIKQTTVLSLKTLAEALFSVVLRQVYLFEGWVHSKGPKNRAANTQNRLTVWNVFSPSSLSLFSEVCQLAILPVCVSEALVKCLESRQKRMEEIGVILNAGRATLGV